jgi:EmrB/QacA subfamily drug resistance transporter
MNYQVSYEKNHSWLLLIALSLILFLINVDYTAVNLALLPIAAELKSTLSTTKWVLSGYALAWAVLVIPGGNFADRCSKKKACLLGLVLFLFSSFLAGIANSSIILIAARILQGMAGAIFIPATYALVYINFEEKIRGYAIGMISLGVGLGMAFGPVIGGILLSWLNWRSIFFINIPIGLISILILLSRKDTEKITQNTPPFSKLSALLLGVSIVVFLFLLDQIQLWSQNSSLYLTISCLAIFSIIIFVYLQNKLSNPLIPLNLFANIPYLGCVLGILLEQYGFSSVIVTIGLFLQKKLLFSVFKTSMIYLCLSMVFGIIAALGGRLVDKIGLRVSTVIGLMVMSIGTALFSILTGVDSLITICAVFTIIGIGMGLAFTGLNTAVVKTVAQQYIGIGSSVFVMCALIGNSLGVTLTTLIYEIYVAHGIRNIMLVTTTLLIIALVICNLFFKKNLIITQETASLAVTS